MKVINLTGQKFGLLTVIERVPGNNPSNRNSRWRCSCECGGKTITTSQHLRTGHTTSCGCRKREKYALKHGKAMKPGRTYRAWLNMRNRCSNPKATQYKDYGGRGIRVCKRWDNFVNFLEDMGEKLPLHEIDRVDVNGNYTPANCRWIPRSSGLKRTTITVVLEGRTLKLGQAAKELGLDYFALYRLMHRQGLSFQQAVAQIKKNLRV